MIKGRKKEEEEGVGMRSVERAEKRAATFAIHRICNNAPMHRH